MSEQRDAKEPDDSDIESPEPDAAADTWANPWDADSNADEYVRTVPNAKI